MDRKTALTTLYLIITVFVLAACRPQPGSFPNNIPETPQPIPLSGSGAGQAVVTATYQPGSPTSHPAPNPAGRLGAAALILEEQPGGHGPAILPVAADTGEPLAGYPPVRIGRDWAFGFSNDRSEMAFISYQPDVCQTYCLRLLNLRTWKEMFLPIPIDTSLAAWFTIPVFDPTSSRIYIINNKQTDTISEVFLADRIQHQVITQTDLPASIFKAALTPEGHLAVYGLRTVPSGAQPEVYLALYDGMDFSLLWEAALPEIPLLVYDSENDPRQTHYYEPAAAFTDDGSRLYLVAADQPLLATVDFQNQTVRTARIERQASWFERLLASTARVVHAKTMNGASKAGVLSPDEQYMYVVGQETREVENDQGGIEMEFFPLGLQVVDLRSGTLVREIETAANWLALSGDGKTLLLHGWQAPNATVAQPWTDIVDLSTWTVVHRLAGTAYPSQLLDGSPAWLLAHEDSGRVTGMEIFRPGETTARSRVTRPGQVDKIVIP